MIQVFVGIYTYVSFTPQRFGALRITVSMTSDDMSCPAEFAGKLYKNRGIYLYQH